MDEVEQELIKKTKEMIQDLKSVCANNGIGNTGNEYKIITQVFLYSVGFSGGLYDDKIFAHGLYNNITQQKSLR